MLEWIQEAAFKRLAQYSTVIVFETCDPNRIEQFTNFLKSDEFNKVFNIKSDVTKILYDPWDGLISLNGNLPIKQEDDSPFSSRSDLESALNYVDEQLRSKTTVFVMRNVAERDRSLNAALRSWATPGSGIYARKSMIIIFTDSADRTLDDYTKSLAAIIKIPSSSIEERKVIIDQIAESFKAVLNLNPPKILPDVTAGLNLHDTQSALMESIRKYRKFNLDHIAKFKAEIVKKSGILELMKPRYGFEAVGGYELTKNFIRKEIINVLKEPERAKAMGVRLPRGILLFGPPGTGKSLIARCLAYELKLPFIVFRLEDIFRSLVGETEQRMRKAIDLIEDIAPCIVFIDEMDRLGHRTDVSTDSGVSRRVFSAFLEWLGDDQRKAIIVGTTNEPEYLDHAMLRAGRLDRKIPLLYPDKDARVKIFKVHTTIHRKVPLAKDVDFKELAEKTELFSGAEIEELVLRSARRAFNKRVKRVHMEHFNEALKTFNIEMDSRRKQLRRYLVLAQRFTDDTEFLRGLFQEVKKYERMEALMKEMMREKEIKEQPGFLT